MNIKKLEKYIKEKDFVSFVYFLSEEVKTRQDLIDLCKKSTIINMKNIISLLKEVTEYIKYSSDIIKAAYRISQANVLSSHTQAKLNKEIVNKIEYDTVLGTKICYFISIIEKNLNT